ncbi:MAG: YbaB/EbfC family nucleoid-associated protein [Alphaproteobacteria bacterium]|nr:YbaB/EbfC family nucleoid-associated protein [Alphaproteobacteria bacterium]
MNIQKMMKQAQEMQNKIAEMQKRMEQEETEGSSGGGSVKILLTGKNTLLKVSIDESLMKPEDREMLEDLIVAAHNDARNKIDTAFNERMSSVTAGLSLPPGFKLPF